MALNQNQFTQTAIVGQRDMAFGGNVISGQISISDPNTAIPGMPLKMEDSIGGVPKFITCTANTDNVFGFALFNVKDRSYAPGAFLEVAVDGAVVYMEAGAAIARGAQLEIVASTTAPKVITNAGTNKVIGKALDKATASGQYIRVWIATIGNTVQNAGY